MLRRHTHTQKRNIKKGDSDKKRSGIITEVSRRFKWIYALCVCGLYWFFFSGGHLYYAIDRELNWLLLEYSRAHQFHITILWACVLYFYNQIWSWLPHSRSKSRQLIMKPPKNISLSSLIINILVALALWFFFIRVLFWSCVFCCFWFLLKSLLSD